MYRLLVRSISVIAILLIFFVVANAESIYEVQYTTNQGSGDDCYPSTYVGSDVSIEGVVTAVVQGNYPDFFIQNPDSTTWNGVYVYDTSVDPQVGDYVTLTGEVSEYYGMTEINYVSEYNIVSHGNALPETLLVTTADLAGGCGFDAEANEGVLVMVQNVTILSDGGHGTFWMMDASGDSCLVDDELYKNGDDQPDPPVQPGMVYDKVIGLVMYSYGEYRINPRGGSDFVVSGNNPPSVMYSYPWDETHLIVKFNMNLDENSAEDDGNYTISDGVSVSQAVLDGTDHSKVTLTTSEQTDGFQYTLVVEGVENEDGVPMDEPDSSIFNGGFTPIAKVQQPAAGSDSSRIAGEYVTVKAVATCDTTDFSKYYFYIQDNSFSYYNGIKVFNTFFDNPQRGDTLVISGLVEEYFGETEIDELEQYTYVASGDEIDPKELPASDLTQGATHAEWYEGVLVGINEPMIVCTLPDSFGNWQVRDTTYADTVDVYKYGSEYDPHLDDGIFVNGVFSYSYSTYDIMPRQGDIEKVGVVDYDENLPFDFDVSQNYPNPFNANTKINYTIVKPAEVNLSIYNLLGERVAFRRYGMKRAGNYSITLNLSEFSSGIYYYRLTAGQYSGIKRMVLLK